MSALTHRRGVWRQTVGRLRGDELRGPSSGVRGQPDGTFLVRDERAGRDSDHVYKRMVFSNIEADAFDWRWEFSPDAETWEQRWAIRYTRR